MNNQTQVTLAENDSANKVVLYMAIEMGEKSWKLLFGTCERKRNGQMRQLPSGERVVTQHFG